MKLGKIKVRIDNIGGNRNYYCRPVIAGENLEHPQRIGVCHVVYMEKNILNQHLKRDDEFTTYCILDKIHSEVEWRAGYTKLKISPITEEIYNQLKLIYPQKEHIFLV